MEENQLAGLGASPSVSFNIQEQPSISRRPYLSILEKLPRLMPDTLRGLLPSRISFEFETQSIITFDCLRRPTAKDPDMNSSATSPWFAKGPPSAKLLCPDWRMLKTRRAADCQFGMIFRV